MNKEIILSKKISEETGKEMVAVTNEKGNIEFRESVNNLPEILEAENSKERIEELLKEHDEKKEQITESIKTNKSVLNIVGKIAPGLMLIIGMLIVASTANPDALVAPKVYKIFHAFSSGLGVNMVLCNVIDLVKENRYLRRKEITNMASISILNHLLDKTNKKIENLNNESILDESVCHDKTIINTKNLSNLNTKLKLIHGCVSCFNHDLKIIDGSSTNEPSFARFSYKHGKNCSTEYMYIFDTNPSQEPIIDERENEIIFNCMKECKEVGLRKVLKR